MVYAHHLGCVANVAHLCHCDSPGNPDKTIHKQHLWNVPSASTAVMIFIDCQIGCYCGLGMTWPLHDAWQKDRNVKGDTLWRQILKSRVLAQCSVLPGYCNNGITYITLGVRLHMANSFCCCQHEHRCEEAPVARVSDY